MLEDREEEFPDEGGLASESPDIFGLSAGVSLVVARVTRDESRAESDEVTSLRNDEVKLRDTTDAWSCSRSRPKLEVELFSFCSVTGKMKADVDCPVGVDSRMAGICEDLYEPEGNDAEGKSIAESSTVAARMESGVWG